MVLEEKLSREEKSMCYREKILECFLGGFCLWIVYIHTPKLLLLHLADKAASLAGKFRFAHQRHDDLWVQQDFTRKLHVLILQKMHAARARPAPTLKANRPNMRCNSHSHKIDTCKYERRQRSFTNKKEPQVVE